MGRWKFALAIAVAFGLAVAMTGTVEPLPIVELDQRPVAIATMPCLRPVQAASSGFVIDDDTVVTVAHAIYESTDFAVRDATGKWHEATIRHMDLARDLAVLTVKHLPAEPMSSMVASSGDVIEMVGGAASGSASGDVLRRVSISTEVIGDRTQTSTRSGYELNVEIKGGDSGAAVVDGEGNLAGLIFARSTRRDASWATSVVEILPALEGDTVPTWTCERGDRPDLRLDPIEPPEPRLAP